MPNRTAATSSELKNTGLKATVPRLKVLEIFHRNASTTGLRHMSAEMVFRMNRLLGENAIDFIEFRVDPVTLAQLVEAETPPARQAAATPPAALVSAASAIADNKLRELFMRAAGNCIARREAMSA